MVNFTKHSRVNAISTFSLNLAFPKSTSRLNWHYHSVGLLAIYASCLSRIRPYQRKQISSLKQNQCNNNYHNIHAKQAIRIKKIVHNTINGNAIHVRFQNNIL